MDTKNMFQWNKTESTENVSKYTPSSSQKKRAVMMYLFFGIMVTITKKEINSFEYYHLKQSSGRWILFFLVLVFDIVLLFIPIIKYIWLIPLLVLVWVWVISTKQAWEWKYFVDKKDSPLALFSWIGNRFIDLFEIKVNTTNTNLDSKDQSLDASIDLWSDNQTNIISESDIETDLNKQQ
jgi:hypothetical protein